MESATFHLLLVAVCLAFVSAVPANEPVTYGNLETSSASAPLETHVLPTGELKPMFVPHGSNSSEDAVDMMHSSPVEGSIDDHDHHREGDMHSSMGSSSTMSDNASSTSSFDDFGDDTSTEPGPTTKASHIMVIPRKNVTMQSENGTGAPMGEEYSATTHEHGDHSKGSSATSTTVLVALTAVLWAVLCH